MTLSQLTQLMKEMRASGVSYVELPGVKLQLAPEVRTKPEFTHPSQIGPVKPGEAARAFDAMQIARQEAALQRKQRLSAMKVGGTGTHTGSLVQDVYDKAMETRGVNGQ